MVEKTPACAELSSGRVRSGEKLCRRRRQCPPKPLRGDLVVYMTDYRQNRDRNRRLKFSTEQLRPLYASGLNRSQRITTIYYALMLYCVATVIGCAEDRAELVMSRAGALVSQSEYCRAQIECEVEALPNERQRLSASLLLGPGKRFRCASERGVLAYDGIRSATVTRNNKADLSHNIEPDAVNPIMLESTALDLSENLPLSTARQFGGLWWKHLYGEDASLRYDGKDEINGVPCHRIRVLGLRGAEQVTWWISVKTNAFRRFAAVGPPDVLGRVRGANFDIAFPSSLQESSF